MKKVLITGANSYVGTNVEKWLMKEPENFYVETLDMRDPNWKNFDFSKFDVVFHVAGIAHVKETKKNRELYFKVNRDLAVNTAIIAKESGVKQFIFMSSMSIFGKNRGKITSETSINPKTSYGVSKYEAELEITKLKDKNFKIVILRPPMIYGLNSPGNYTRIINFVGRVKIFPEVFNKRSVLYIKNLTEFIKIIIKENHSGIFHPQNNLHVSTFEIIEKTLKLRKIKIIKIYLVGYIFKQLNFKIFNKVFGDLYYENIDTNEFEYTIFTFEQSLIDMVSR